MGGGLSLLGSAGGGGQGGARVGQAAAAGLAMLVVELPGLVPTGEGEGVLGGAGHIPIVRRGGDSYAGDRYGRRHVVRHHHPF